MFKVASLVLESIYSFSSFIFSYYYNVHCTFHLSIYMLAELNVLGWIAGNSVLYKHAGRAADSAIALFHSARGRTWEPREGAHRDVESQEGSFG